MMSLRTEVWTCECVWGLKTYVCVCVWEEREREGWERQARKKRWRNWQNRPQKVLVAGISPPSVVTASRMNRRADYFSSTSKWEPTVMFYWFTNAKHNSVLHWHVGEFDCTCGYSEGGIWSCCKVQFQHLHHLKCKCQQRAGWSKLKQTLLYVVWCRDRIGHMNMCVLLCAYMSVCVSSVGLRGEKPCMYLYVIMANDSNAGLVL